MADKLHIERLKERFKGKSTISSENLAIFYKESEPNVKETTINWRIYELVRMGILERISRGQFRIGQMKPYAPEPSRQLSKLYKDLSTHFPYIQLCIWETGWLNDLGQHLSNRSWLILETEKDACEPVFHKLQDNNKAVFLEPTLEMMERYVSIESNPIIVKAMVSEGPFQNSKGVNIPMLEKILVDLVCDTDIFYAYQGRELEYIWENAFSRYTVLQDKLLRYASRRRRKREISEYIKKLYNPAAI
ncbi:hypothetical protein SAMN04488109_4014 [Chryseolinea serpens]|uniref:Uncharacterized protein n=1 Tax=Chryseolinea serpens TaxID=947013 RepID=A0A1M5TDU1_9BACT|nr:DUF6577 family protein [Chryseolinea serpens]SHH48902.1 hypothetical protein SAMN04488109_4014 [Chryseolinea serpens]